MIDLLRVPSYLRAKIMPGYSKSDWRELFARENVLGKRLIFFKLFIYIY